MTTPVKTDQPKNLIEMRSAIFDNAKPISKVIDFFGQQIELRQPSLKVTLEREKQQAEGQHASTALLLINYAYIPGTDELMFTDEDIDRILAMPWGKDFNRVVDAVGSMTNINAEVKEAEKN